MSPSKETFDEASEEIQRGTYFDEVMDALEHPNRLYSRRTILRKGGEITATAIFAPLIINEIDMSVRLADLLNTSSTEARVPSKNLGITIDAALDNETIKELLTMSGDRVRIAGAFDMVSPVDPETAPPSSPDNNPDYPYDFSRIDRVIDMAREKGKKIDLQLGIKTFGWPEVNAPQWFLDKYRYTKMPEPLNKDTQRTELDRDPEAAEQILHYLEASTRHFLQKYPDIASLHIENEGLSRNIEMAGYRSVSKEFYLREIDLVRRIAQEELGHQVPVKQNFPFETPDLWDFVIENSDIIDINFYQQLDLNAFDEGLWWGMFIIAVDKIHKAGKKVNISEYQISPWEKSDNNFYDFSEEKALEGIARIRKICPEAVIYLWQVELLKRLGKTDYLNKIKNLSTSFLDKRGETILEQQSTKPA